MDVVYRYDPFGARSCINRSAKADESARVSGAEGINRYATIVMQVHREVLGGPASEQIIIPSNPLSLGLPRVAGTAVLQTPYAIVLGCSDARVPIELISRSGS